MEWVWEQWYVALFMSLLLILSVNKALKIIERENGRISSVLGALTGVSLYVVALYALRTGGFF
ncbi:MAG: hypothetical protein GOVbin631_75 [Prokaryotic dsDNA virus sp.]|nr:MAG: hypothetical protein GOVbin631_75 [Prokaryotic dsDNA virus sp.]|tara:strand:- start:50 stop:238 length:189 start_codon:yes stop_codon:yes gene_type:complete